MQRILLLVLLGLSASSICKGQNWRPFRSNLVHGYRLGGGWSSRVYTLSVTEGRALVLGDTVWGYRPSLQAWDSCGQYALKATSFSPFGNRIRKSITGLTFYLKDSAGIPDSVVLRTGLVTGSTYSLGRHDVSYEGSRIEATPAGTNDSIRVYQVDGQSVLWSKSYGLLQMPALATSGYFAEPYFDRTYSYSQIAIDRIYGVRIPKEADFYDYAPGDTLGMFYQPSAPTASRLRTRTIIRARIVDSAKGLLLYPCTVWTSRQAWSYMIYEAPQEDTLQFDLKQPVLCGFRDSTLPAMGYLVLSTGQADSITEMEYTTGYRKEGNCYSQVIDGMTLYTLTRGRGITFYNDGLGTGSQECYSIRGQGIPCGRIVTSTLGGLDRGCQLADNPISTQLEVLSPTPLHLILQDLQGRTVAEGWDTRTLDVRMLPTGLYQLRAQDKQGRSQVLRVAKN